MDGQGPRDWMGLVKLEDYSLWELEADLAEKLHHNIKFLKTKIEAYIAEGLFIIVPHTKTAKLADVLAQLEKKLQSDSRHQKARADQQVQYDIGKAKQLRQKEIQQIKKQEERKMALDKQQQVIENKQRVSQLNLLTMEDPESAYNFLKKNPLSMNYLKEHMDNMMYKKLFDYITIDLELERELNRQANNAQSSGDTVMS
jgi:hypothetical protein